MEVRIIKCSNDKSWYKPHIGEVFDCYSLQKGDTYYELYAKSPDGDGLIINLEDGEEVKPATEAQSIDSPLPPKSEEELRDKFLKEFDVELAAEDATTIFNWFKPYLKTPIK